MVVFKGFVNLGKVKFFYEKFFEKIEVVEIWFEFYVSLRKVSRI